MGLSHNISSLLTLRWLRGAIFGKEIRVLARQRRFYFLRSLYLILLLILMCLMWVEVTDVFQSVVYNVSRMAEASKLIVSSIGWFQFIAVQIVAIVICSTAINSEVHNRTLYVLMTTPITPFQIVMGKLLSRLWQVVLLLMIGFPLLAMVRVFGGIPWDYLISTLCVTLCTVVFASVLTIFCSILFKRAYVAMLFSVIGMGVVFAFIPFLVFFLEEGMDLLPTDFTEKFVLYSNPYALMLWETEGLFYNHVKPAISCWPIQCGVLLILSGLVLFFTCKVVRRAALRHTVPKLNRKKYKVPPRSSKGYWLKRPIFIHSLVKHTIGTGMLWKEFLHPVLGGFRKPVFGAFVFLVVSFVVSIVESAFSGNINLVGFVIGVSAVSLSSFCVLFTVIIPATYITAEKEGGTWLVLLTTCYSDWQILGGKIVGVSRRILLVWAPFLFIFSLIAYVADYPLWFFLRPILAGLVGVGFVISTGLYFSSRFKHSTAAVIWNLSLVAVCWVGIPFVADLLGYLDRGFYLLNRFIFIIKMFSEIMPPQMIMQILEYSDAPKSWYSAREELALWAWYAGVHAVMIGLFLWRAKANLRKRIL